MKTKKIKLSVIIALVVAAGIFALSKSKSSADSGELIIDNDTSESEVSSEEAVDTVEAVSEEQMVYICGEVVNPGVYKAGAGARISDVLDMAGGATPDADLKGVNLARQVNDGEQIVIGNVKDVASAVTESSGVSPQNSGSGLININNADKTSLMSLPGIGEVKAESIITYRNENGSFKKIEDVMKVSGIKDASFQKIKDLITV